MKGKCSLGSAIRRTKHKWHRFLGLSSLVGLGPALICSSSLLLGRLTRLRPSLRLRLRGYPHPLWIRLGASDLRSLSQVFLEEEYRDIGELSPGGVIIDCGANVGCSSVYFLEKYPNCRVLAVEPDGGNVAVLKRNLAPYAERAEIVQAGVWSERTLLSFRRERFRDGTEWTRQLECSRTGDSGDIVGVGVADLLARTSRGRIALLKMDIEGAEAVVFGAGPQAWLERVEVLAIELHPESDFGDAVGVFFSAIAPFDFVVTTRGELTICRRPHGA